MSEVAKRGRTGVVDSIFMTFPCENQTFRESRTRLFLEGAGETKLEQQRHDPQLCQRRIALSLVDTSGREWKRNVQREKDLLYLVVEFSITL